ncbi:MAG: hypothetical protein ACI4R9_00795 [Kiritimatiellia bacterium]
MMNEKQTTKGAEQPPAHIQEAVDVVRRFLRRLKEERSQVLESEKIEGVR